MCACVRIGLGVGGGGAPPSGLGGGLAPPPRGPRGGAPRCPPRSSGWAVPFPAAGPGCWAPRGAGGAGLPLRVCFRRGGAFAPPRGARQRCSGPAHLGHIPPPPPLGFSFTPGFSAWGGGVGWGVLWRVGRLPPPSGGRGGVPSASGLGEGHCPSLLSPAWGLWGTAAWVTIAWGHIQRRLRCLCGGPSPPVSLAAGWSTGGSPPSVVPRTRAGRGALSHGGGP